MARNSKPADLSKERLVEQVELASALNVAPSTVNRWLKETPPVPTELVDGKTLYPLSRCLHWWKNREVDKAVTTSAPLDIAEAKARRESALAELAEYDLAVKKGNLILRDEAVALFESKLSNIVNKLSQLGGNKYAASFLNLDTLPDAQIALKRLGSTLREEIVMEEGSESDHDRID
jgi:hypothetical protein